MTQSENVFELHDLKVKRGGVRTLEISSFSLKANEFVSLIGPNGAGKSTLLLAVLGLIRLEGGTVRFHGRPVDSDAARLDLRRRIAMVLQEPLLFDCTVYENVASGLKIRGLGRTETRERVMTYLERFNLVDLSGRHARKLSGGEARRVSLARAFAVEPEVIFFDEPFTNLDPPTRQSLTEDMDRVIREKGIAAILVTHDQSEALRMSDRLVVLNSGKIVQEGRPAEVMNAPVDEFVANFVGMETILEGVVQRNQFQKMTVKVGEREIDAIGRLLPGDPAYCCIRPENVTVSLGSPALNTSARNVFPAKVAEVMSQGPFLKLRLDCGFQLTAFLTHESFTSLSLQRGSEVYASFKATSVHVIPRR